MTHALNHKRWIAGLLATALAVTSLTPAAEAGHGKGRRYKGEFRGHSGYAPQRVIVRERSNAGPLIAGLIGGVVLGTAIANASHSDGYYSRAEVGYVRGDDGCGRRGYGYSRARFAPPPPRYRYSYYDPYCGERFQSLDLCRAHYRGGCDHPRVVMMIDIRSGACVQRYRYSRGGWQDYDDAGWDGNGYAAGYGRDHGQYNDQGDWDEDND